MKNALFIFYATINSWILEKINNVTNTMTMMTVHAAHAVFAIIDDKRLGYLRSVVEQQEVIDELKIFTLIESVKNNAIDLGEWNEDHETQFNMLGNLLYTEHDWEVEQVHKYLTDVIERAEMKMPGN